MPEESSGQFSGPAVRAHAARALKAIHKDNRSIDWVLENRPKWFSTPLSQELIYGCLRHHFSLSQQVSAALSKPIRNKDWEIMALLLVGAYQLRHTSIPNHAVLNETVSSLKPLQKIWAKGLVNAVLRRLSEDIDAVAAAEQTNPQNNQKIAEGADPDFIERSFDHPYWLASLVVKQYGNLASTLLEAHNQRAPLSLRVNTRTISREAYGQELSDESIQYEWGAPEQSVMLAKPTSSANLPAWSKGTIAVQDMGAQFAAELLLQEATLHAVPRAPLSWRVLDACAAPGGKLMHLWERMNSLGLATPGSLLGIELNPKRIKSTQHIMDRLGHEIPLEQGDASAQDWWQGNPFTHILADVPCSGTGTLRRHPDIKVLLTEHAVEQVNQLQRQILENLWQMLAPGGTLLYCTCSVLAQENDMIVGEFVKQQSEPIKITPIHLPTGLKTEFGWQLLPTDPRTDGFYYALLHKPTATT